MRMSEQAAKQLAATKEADREARLRAEAEAEEAKQAERVKRLEQRAALNEQRSSALKAARASEERLRTVFTTYQSSRADRIEVREACAEQAEQETIMYEQRAARLRKLAEEAERAAEEARQVAERAREEAGTAKQSIEGVGVELENAYGEFLDSWGRINPTRRRRKLWDNELRKRVRDLLH